MQSLLAVLGLCILGSGLWALLRPAPHSERTELLGRIARFDGPVREPLVRSALGAAALALALTMP